MMMMMMAMMAVMAMMAMMAVMADGFFPSHGRVVWAGVLAAGSNVWWVCVCEGVGMCVCDGVDGVGRGGLWGCCVVGC